MSIGAFANFSDGQLHVTGQNATAGIFASYPREDLSLLNGFVDQVSVTQQIHYSKYQMISLVIIQSNGVNACGLNYLS